MKSAWTGIQAANLLSLGPFHLLASSTSSDL